MIFLDVTLCKGHLEDQYRCTVTGAISAQQGGSGFLLYVSRVCLALRQYGVFFRKSVKKNALLYFPVKSSYSAQSWMSSFARMNVVTPPSQKVAMSVWSESKIAVLFYFSQRTLQAAASAWTYLQPASFWLESRHLPLCSWGHTPRACTLPQVFLLPASLFLLNRRNTFCPSTLSLCPVLPLFS